MVFFLQLRQTLHLLVWISNKAIGQPSLQLYNFSAVQLGTAGQQILFDKVIHFTLFQVASCKFDFVRDITGAVILANSSNQEVVLQQKTTVLEPTFLPLSDRGGSELRAVLKIFNIAEHKFCDSLLDQLHQLHTQL